MPPAAVTCCTIGDYLAMRLCGLAAPLMDDSNAASIGFFDAERCAFDQNALQKAGIDPNFVPQLAAEPVIGRFRNASVCAAIGDNQASFLRSVRDKTAEMLVNVGTGSQFSVFTPHYLQADGLETRPMPGGGYLLAVLRCAADALTRCLSSFSAPPRPCSARRCTAATTQWRVC